MSKETVKTIVNALRHHAERSPDRRAFLFLKDGERETGSLTFGELDQRARAIASRLMSLGASGQQILLLFPPGLEFVASFFGCLYAGAVAVPSYSSLLSRRNLARLQFLVRDADVKLLLTVSDALNKYEQSLTEAERSQIPALVASDEIAIEEAASWPEMMPEPDALAYIQYTSGSTSDPRGVVISHGNIIHNQRMIHALCRPNEGMPIVSWLPHFHDMGLVGVIQQTVYAGLSSVLMPPLEFIRKPVRWLRAISKYRARESGGPNFGYELCVERITPEQASGLDLSCWERAFNGSEPVRAGTMESFAARFAAYGFQAASFLPCYGLAEATLLVSGRAGPEPPLICEVNARELEQGHFQEADASVAGELRRIVGCGQLWCDERVLVVDTETRRCCPPGRIGEIWVSGPHIAGGYWKREETTHETFGARLADTGDGPFLRTGDLGCMFKGELFVTGRLKDMIILRGKNHYPQDIEATVALSHPALRPSCSAAFSVDVNGQEELVVLQEVKGRTRSEDAFDIYAAIRQALAEEHAVKPHAIILLAANTIPRTTSGKIRRSVCRDKFLESAFREAAFC